MGVGVTKSITAKLFFLVVLIVGGTVGLFATKNALDLETLLKAQLKDRSLNDSAISGRSIQGILENWESQIGVVLQATLQIEDHKVRVEQIKRFLENREEFAAIQIWEHHKKSSKELLYQFTPHVLSNKFNKKIPSKISSNIRVANQNIAENWLGKVKGRFVRSLAHKKVTDLPLVSIGKVFNVKGLKSQYVVIFTAWQSPLVEALVESNVISNFVLDSRSRVVISRDIKQLSARTSYQNFALVKKAIKSNQPQGFADRYWGSFKGRKLKTEYLGAYYRISKYGLIVMSQQKRSTAYADIDSSINIAIKWGLMFLLIAILVSFFGAEGVTRKLKLVTLATQRIADGDFSTRLGLRSRDEVGVLSRSVDAMASRIQHLLKEQVKQAETARDLEMAQAVQETLFPKANRTRDILVVEGFSVPAAETGGDWWGHYSTGDGIEYIFIADAMGHGVPAALVTAVAYSSCMTLVHMLAESNQIYYPGEILDRVNRVLYDAVEGTISMTFFALMIDYQSGKITYANAGHNFPILIPKDPDDSRIKKKIRYLKSISDKTPLSLRVNGTILGVEKDVTFKEESMELRPGDKFFLFTDGLIECKSPLGGMWGRKTLLERLMVSADFSSEIILSNIKEEAFAFFATEPRDDDLTIVVAEFPETAKIGGYGRSDSAVVNARANAGKWVSGRIPGGAGLAENLEDSVGQSQALELGLDSQISPEQSNLANIAFERDQESKEVTSPVIKINSSQDSLIEPSEDHVSMFMGAFSNSFSILEKTKIHSDRDQSNADDESESNADQPTAMANIDNSGGILSLRVSQSSYRKSSDQSLYDLNVDIDSENPFVSFETDVMAAKEKSGESTKRSNKISKFEENHDQDDSDSSDHEPKKGVFILGS